MTYKIEITPQPTPRPRVGKRACNTEKYRKYKHDLVFLIKGCHVIKKDYTVLSCIFRVPWPKSTAKKHLIEDEPMLVTPDLDNYVKGFQDALQKAGVLKNDGQIWKYREIAKVRTINKIGSIEFELW